MLSYPENCLRGISSKDCVKNNKPRAHLFYFHDRDKREDGKIEQSITWEDDENSIKVLSNQKKDNGEIQFKFGIVRIPLANITRINTFPQVNGAISYERDPIEGNCYHGNLLISADTDSDVKLAIAATLLLAVKGEVINNPNTE